MTKKNTIIFHVKNNIIRKIILFLLYLIIFLFVLLFVLSFYLKGLGPLPNVKAYKKIKMPETSVIYDRNGVELYKIYSEKRTYVKYSDINKNMINAIVAGEDKRYWTHSGYDLIGIFRAFIDGLVSGKQFSGTSGITQQLVKVTYLSSERTIERKVKELILSIELDSFFDKKEVLEFYLNKIFFGGNSYGIEQSSQTFFGIKASELGVLESSILAALPKAPSGLSPYYNKDKLLGYPNIVNDDNIKVLSIKDFILNKEYLEVLEDFLYDLRVYNAGDYLRLCGINKLDLLPGKFIIEQNGCINIKFNDLLLFLNSISIEHNNSYVGYKTGRKDYVLGRMLEDGYITFDEYRNALVKSFGFEFKRYSDDIKYPHFVMYVIENLYTKYGEKFIKESGLKIYTTIDSKLQDKAQELIVKQVEKNTEKFGARNAALLSLDNKTGEILSMVGGVDYFDIENEGFNNMIFARLQPGSTFKPFIYMLGMIKEGFTKDTIFTDKTFTFPGDYTPKNSDGKYMGKMTLSKALNYSRNIPAVKVYYAAGQEEEIIKFLTPFGMKSLLEFKKEFREKYGYNYIYLAPMALGTVQITPFELAGAYSVLANSGIKKEITPIIKVVDGFGNIIESIDLKDKGTRILDQKYTLQMNSILSNTKDRPYGWNYFLSIPDRQIAAKTGTSSKQYKKNPDDEKETIAPMNLWTIGYTPQITTVVWAGNTSGEELKGKAYGLTGAGPIMRDFMDFAHEDLGNEEWGE